MNRFKASVIISTYNQPLWLQKVLWSYEMQTETDFEIVIADDGSTDETKNLIDDFNVKSKLSIKHIWQEDKGFRKTKILNKAIIEASSDYLIFTDGDCVARQDFVETHLKLRRYKSALSGGYFKLSKAISEIITEEDIQSQVCFKSDWLLSHGLKKTFKINKLTSYGFKAWFLNTFTPTKATFDGMNVSCWKQNILDVNGFDERMEYGGEDRELGERLINNGIKFIQARYSVICLHLFHDRPYVDQTKIKENIRLRKTTRHSKSKYTKYGIYK